MNKCELQVLRDRAKILRTKIEELSFRKWEIEDEAEALTKELRALESESDDSAAYVAELEESLRLKTAECEVLEAKYRKSEYERKQFSSLVSTSAIKRGQLEGQIKFLESELEYSGLYHYENGEFVRRPVCNLA